ncbi:ELMO domain-containing protein 3 [Gryllus bimaculatus]|nr:ELMO domain-containing protein 3 [Gryllus bimaculatus]
MPVESNEDLPQTAFERHRQTVQVEDGRLAIEVAQQEWDNVATIETTYSIQTQPVSHITYQEAFEYFLGLDMSEHMGNIQVEVQRRGLCTLLSCIMGPPHLETGLAEERSRLDVSQTIHVKILQTIYYRLTGASVGCPCFGSHWEHIGFQGSDPGTDLRGVGMLGLLQLLYLCTTPQLSSLAKRIYRLSVDVVQNFPLAILSFNFSRMALQALRHGQLNRECNERQLVMDVVNDFYAALFYHMVHIWTTQRKTIRDSGYVLKDVEFFCRSNVHAVLKNLKDHLTGNCEAPNEKFCFHESFHDLRTQAKSEVFI